MKIVCAKARVIPGGYTPHLEKIIEHAGRVCYKSERAITEDSAPLFVAKVRSLKHESVLEHGSISVLFVVDRGVSHELVRHRLASFSQESTRYCNYSKDRFDGELSFINPKALKDMHHGTIGYDVWKHCMEKAEIAYHTMISSGYPPQAARSILPNSLKTELVMTANPREWRHVFKLRCDEAAHPQMREVMVPLLADFAKRWPSLFADLLPA